MTSPLNIRQFLQDVIVNKARAKLTITEFDSLLEIADQIQKFSEKGLLIVTLTQQLHKMSNVNYVSIKKFMNDFLAGLKPERPRKQRQQAPQRRRRQRPAQSAQVPRDINGMAQESISQSSNFQLTRIGVQGQNQQSDLNMISENASKRSDQNQRDLQFAEQLNKISEGVELVTGQDFELQHQQQLEEYSKGSSSSQSFGVVSNFSEKMDLLKLRDQGAQKKTKTARRPPGVEATLTKKKGTRANVVDENLTLQKTRGTLNETFYSQERQIPNRQYSPQIDQYYYRNELFQMTNQQFHETANDKRLSIFNDMMLSAKKDQRRGLYEIPTDLTQFDTGYQGEGAYDFTSQPMPDLSQFQQNNQIQLNELSVFKYQDSSPTLEIISAQVNRPQATVFYEMLSKMQKGEIIMTQQNVKEFSEIRIELLS